MPQAPDGLTLSRHRDLRGLEKDPWIRRILLGLVTVTLLFGLLNVFGQRPGTSVAAGPAAKLTLYTPARVRGGLLFESRIHIRALHELKDAIVVLDPGWLEGLTINTIEPSPVGEASRDGRLALDLGHIRAGHSHILFIQFQVNPTNVGRRSQRLDLYDGAAHLLTIHHRITVWP